MATNDYEGYFLALSKSNHNLNIYSVIHVCFIVEQYTE
jgi:hypothetical protein